jgi:pimeloyl-ACP methyl ester carboxylesterase
MKHIPILGRQIEIVHLASAHPRPDAPAMLFLHEGLGSVTMWRDFPQRVSDATGCEAIVFSRTGYGRSEAIDAPRTVRYMHDEALVVLPSLIDALKLERPFLFGHSDGGSIALIHAGAARQELSGVIAMAPHVLVEDVSVASIAAAKATYETTDLRERLARYHQNVDSAFWGWNDIWLHPDFRTWNIEAYLPAISCPLLAIQGEDDEYGSMAQVNLIAQGAPDVDLVKLADCRHSPHKDQPEAVIAAVADFVARILDAQA